LRSTLIRRRLLPVAAWLFAAHLLHAADVHVPVAELRAHVEFLASDALGGRATPSEGLDIAAEYIAAQFRRAGLEPAEGSSYFQIAAPGKRNVVAVLPGSDPQLRSTYVLVTAHYDHVGTKPSAEPDRIYNGANDNASGVASLIETADALTASEARPLRTVVFIAYYGEEQGMLGSTFYATNPIFPIESTVAQINLEQTGRTDDREGANVRTLNVTGFDYSEVPQILSEAAAATGVQVVKREKWSDLAFKRSDNEVLAKRGVPAHTVSVSYMFPDYHRVSDEWQKLDYPNMAAVTEAIAAGVAAIANRTEPPRWYSGVSEAEPYSRNATAMAAPVTPPAAPPAASGPGLQNSPASRRERRSRRSQQHSTPAPASPRETERPQTGAPARPR
jgi:hypothetical protein